MGLSAERQPLALWPYPSPTPTLSSQERDWDSISYSEPSSSSHSPGRSKAIKGSARASKPRKKATGGIQQESLRARGISPGAEQRLVDAVYTACLADSSRTLRYHSEALNEARAPKPRFPPSELDLIRMRVRMKIKRGSGGIKTDQLAARGITKKHVSEFVDAVVHARLSNPTMGWDFHASAVNAQRDETARFTEQEVTILAMRAHDKNELGSGGIKVAGLAARGIDVDDLEHFIDDIVAARAHNPNVSWKQYAQSLNQAREIQLRFTAREIVLIAMRARMWNANPATTRKARKPKIEPELIHTQLQIAHPTERDHSWLPSIFAMSPAVEQQFLEGTFFGQLEKLRNNQSLYE